jgi:hypothetical protein
MGNICKYVCYFLFIWIFGGGILKVFWVNPFKTYMKRGSPHAAADDYFNLYEDGDEIVSCFSNNR